MKIMLLIVGSLSVGILACIEKEKAPTLSRVVSVESQNAKLDAFSLGDGDGMHRFLFRWTMKPGWHIYWKNPGEAGMAPRFQWTLPPDAQAKPVLWPKPKAWTVEGITNFILPDTAFLEQHIAIAPAELGSKIDKQANSKRMTLPVRVDWLECHEECLPASAHLVLDPSQVDSSEVSKARLQRPQPWNGQVRALEKDSEAHIDLGPWNGSVPDSLVVFSAIPGWLQSHVGKFSLENGRLRFQVATTGINHGQSWFEGVLASNTNAWTIEGPLSRIVNDPLSNHKTGESP